MIFKAIIVEDEPLSRLFLQNLLAEFCPQVQVLTCVSTEDDAVEAINTLQPNLVFLDIELQQGTGFEVLKKVKGICPNIIFTTAYDHHALNAIKFCGAEYLQKPIDIENLQQVMKTITDRRNSNDISAKHLIETLQNNYVPTHLCLSTTNGMHYVLIKDIVRIESFNCESVFYLATTAQIVGNKSIKEYEELLGGHQFLRIHPLHIINVRKVNINMLQVAGYVVMSDNSTLPVSPKKANELMSKLATDSN